MGRRLNESGTSRARVTDMTRNAQTGDRNFWVASIGGLLAGAGATWLMTRYQAAAAPVVRRLFDGHGEGNPQTAAASEDPAPIRVGSLIYEFVIGEPLPEDWQERAGNLVHYGFGTFQGGQYGALAEASRISGLACVGFGLAFGASLWASVDETILPLLQISRPPAEYPLSSHVNGLLAHLVYGAALGGLVSAGGAAVRALESAGRARSDAGDSAPATLLRMAS